MNETIVTLRGYVGGTVQLRTAGDTVVANFRLGCTPRRFSRKTNEWSDDETQWYAVSAWRSLGENCATSLKLGEPVVVHGRLTHRTWINANNVEQLGLEVEALMVGHDLHRGTSVFTKTAKPEPAATAAPVAEAPAAIQAGAA